MGASIKDGPIHVSGSLQQLLGAAGQGQAGSIIEPDPNNDAGPSLFFQGTGIMDIRYAYLKDRVQGYTGMVPAHLGMPCIEAVNQIPVAVDDDIIAAAANAVQGVAMVLAASSLGFTTGIPISPLVGYGGLNGQPIITAAALDFGFDFGNVTSGSTTIVVTDSTIYRLGMPLVIGGCGNAGGTIPLLTNIASVTDATHIVIVDSPLASNATAPIGTGNIWGPSENGFPTPTAAQPYIARGPGLFLDPRQSIQRAVRISSADGAASGGNFLVSGYDNYGMALSELVTVAAAASTGYSTKTFKYITSVVPQFNDAHPYKCGTADVYGFAVLASLAAYQSMTWNLLQVTDGVGFTAADRTAATTTTHDVRGTVQVSTTGGGTPITNANASNGALVGLVLTGRRLVVLQDIPVSNMVAGLPTDTRTIYGVTQA